ncbi:hypothetical protein [Pandoraea sputorum]|uniref:Uncharacterized protein n=1 Tax=Pandoraea sputorum TaxID=93222 RepID=A0A5E5BNI4_9BURK|nr:hypothetical protein [Pandoraea sputorum]VVE85860.1 hypothetical protein PSP31121_05493 [Pandoraea sputorum]
MLNTLAKGGAHSVTPLTLHAGLVTLPDGLEVPATLDFRDPEALAAARHALLEAPALQRWCEQASDGVEQTEVRNALVTLIFYARADGEEQELEALLGARQTARDTVAAHLTPAGNEALRQTLAEPAVPHAFSLYLAPADRVWLVDQGWRQEAEARLSAGAAAQAAIIYTTAAATLVRLPGQQGRAAALYALAAKAHQQANELAAAAGHLMTAGDLERVRADHLLDHLETLLGNLNVRSDEGEVRGDEVDCHAAMTSAATHYAGAAALHTTLQQPERAIDAHTKAAEALAEIGRFMAAAALHTKIANTWTQIAAVHRRAGELELAATAAQQAALADAAALVAYGEAATAHIGVNEYGPAGHAFTLARQHALAGKAFMWAAQQCETDADEYREAEPTAAQAAAQQALVYYALASAAYQRAAADARTNGSDAAWTYLQRAELARQCSGLGLGVLRPADLPRPPGAHDVPDARAPLALGQGGPPR